MTGFRIPAAPLLTALALAACAGPPSDGPAVDAGAARVALAPTDPDSLPDAVLGTAPPPQGVPVHYFPADPATTGYLAVPDGATADDPVPAVILIHEWDGLTDRIRQTADALAAEGYVAFAADLYSGRTGDNPEENRALIRETMSDPERVIANLDAAAEFVRELPYTTGRIATIGWCFGGGIALSYALGGEHHAGTAIFYGRLVTDPERLASIRHPVYGTFAELDSGIPPERVHEFVEALRAAGIPNDVHVYDAVNHGFWLWVGQDPETRRAPALDAWQRLKGYLGRVLDDR